MTELAVYQPAEVVPIAHSFDDWIPVLREVVGLAEAIHDSPFVPDGLRGSIPAVAAAILTGRELGIPPMTALANIHLIKGKTGLSALLMRALIQSKGHQWEDVTVTDTRVVIKGKRRGEAEWTEASFNADQAKAAGIQLHPYPQDKLYARASVRLARRKFADVIAGMPYSAEELEDGVIEQAETIEAPPPAAEQPKPRTAQRRIRAVDKPDPTTAAPAASTPGTPPATAYPDQPPLPGEDEPDDTDYDTPGTASPDQLTALWATFTTDFAFTKDDKAQARTTVEQIIGRKLAGGTTANLSRNEASMAIDTLKRCGTKERLIVLLATGQMPEDDA